MNGYLVLTDVSCRNLDTVLAGHEEKRADKKISTGHPSLDEMMWR